MFDAVAQARIWHFLENEADRHGIGLVPVSHSSALVDCVATRVVRPDGRPLRPMSLSALACVRSPLFLTVCAVSLRFRGKNDPSLSYKRRVVGFLTRACRIPSKGDADGAILLLVAKRQFKLI